MTERRIIDLDEYRKDFLPRPILVTEITRVEEIPLLLEAASLEGDVMVAILKGQGEEYANNNGKEKIKSIVPEGCAQIRISAKQQNTLDNFWNTVEALRTYDLQEDPQV